MQDQETCQPNTINPNCYQCQGSGFRPDVLEVVHFDLDGLTPEEMIACENYKQACPRHQCYFLSN